MSEPARSRHAFRTHGTTLVLGFSPATSIHTPPTSNPNQNSHTYTVRSPLGNLTKDIHDSPTSTLSTLSLSAQNQPLPLSRGRAATKLPSITVTA